jgi:hypothetical protein
MVTVGNDPALFRKNPESFNHLLLGEFRVNKNPIALSVGVSHIRRDKKLLMPIVRQKIVGCQEQLFTTACEIQIGDKAELPEKAPAHLACEVGFRPMQVQDLGILNIGNPTSERHKSSVMIEKFDINTKFFKRLGKIFLVGNIQRVIGCKNGFHLDNSPSTASPISITSSEEAQGMEWDSIFPCLKHFEASSASWKKPE